jgi:hypothetical protein
MTFDRLGNTGTMGMSLLLVSSLSLAATRLSYWGNKKVYILKDAFNTSHSSFKSILYSAIEVTTVAGCTVFSAAFAVSFVSGIYFNTMATTYVVLKKPTFSHAVGYGSLSLIPSAAASIFILAKQLE